MSKQSLLVALFSFVLGLAGTSRAEEAAKAAAPPTAEGPHMKAMHQAQEQGKGGECPHMKDGKPGDCPHHKGMKDGKEGGECPHMKDGKPGDCPHHKGMKDGKEGGGCPHMKDGKPCDCPCCKGMKDGKEGGECPHMKDGKPCDCPHHKAGPAAKGDKPGKQSGRMHRPAGKRGAKASPEAEAKTAKE